ncbi:hypothetical protein L1D14_04185 [Vibrio tubiashii]|uniref:hypothetical protein n=1 Tax=Vibrio tubiashii TaxID=29498 RepID=UPI001EFD5F3E|nr:hypothetical protein [Vibrio tubiashii]MCG9575430.1 hypothetical protein [Vibrio tubiashii]
MTTTIQVVQDLKVGKYVVIDGTRCEVEHTSFTPAITQKLALTELVGAMSQELMERNIIKRDDTGSFFWVESGEPLIEETEYQD